MISKHNNTRQYEIERGKSQIAKSGTIIVRMIRMRFSIHR